MQISTVHILFGDFEKTATPWYVYDFCKPWCRCHSGKSAGSRHDHALARRRTHGEEKCSHSPASCGRDAGKCHRYLFWQDRNFDRKQNDNDKIALLRGTGKIVWIFHVSQPRSQSGRKSHLPLCRWAVLSCKKMGKRFSFDRWNSVWF